MGDIMNRQQMDYRNKVIANRAKPPAKKESQKALPLEGVQIGFGAESLFKTSNSRPLFGAGRSLAIH